MAIPMHAARRDRGGHRTAADVHRPAERRLRRREPGDTSSASGRSITARCSTLAALDRQRLAGAARQSVRLSRRHRARHRRSRGALGYVAPPASWFSAPDFSRVFLKLDVWGALQLVAGAGDHHGDADRSVRLAVDVHRRRAGGEPRRRERRAEESAPGARSSIRSPRSAPACSAARRAPPTSRALPASAWAAAPGSPRSSRRSAFCPCLFIAPLAAAIPNYATVRRADPRRRRRCSRPVTRVPFDRLEIAVPAFATLILIPLTFSITQGILWGFILHAALHAVVGPAAATSPRRPGAWRPSPSLYWSSNMATNE